MSGIAVAMAFGFLIVPAAQAQWTGKGEAGALISRGNADATSANAKLDVARESGVWKNSAFLGMLYGRNATFTTAQRTEARWQTDYKINERLFWFGALRGEQDKFSGFQYQATLSTGAGYKFIDNDATQLTGTLGVGYRRLRPEVLIKSVDGEVLDRIEGDATGDAVASAGMELSHQLTATTKLLNKLLVESGSSNTSAQNDFAVQVSVTDKVALSVGYGVHYNTDPPAGAESTDQLTTINLVYSIKR
jgi:putative salt-induced outer membrane protein